MNRASRRDFLTASLLGAGVASLGLLAFTRYADSKEKSAIADLMGPLQAVRDETTGLHLVLLPEGFRYRSFSWAGSTLSDGFKVPRLADGMGVVRDDGTRVTLVRNHELVGSSGPIGNPDTAYDVTGGGTTTLVFNTVTESLEDSWVSLGGTLMNCAGGVTPWGSWLTCEEGPISPELMHLPVPTRNSHWKIYNARRPHGYVFEVPAEGVADPEPIVDMGQFYHEAVTFDGRSGIAYLTEDQNPLAGIYRYLSRVEGDLLEGGRLQMMRVDGGRDMRTSVIPGQKMKVEWVDIPEPGRGFTPNNRHGDGVVTQGLANGGSPFIALEGCTCLDGRVYFTSKLGGAAWSGAVYEYNIDGEWVRMVFESSGSRMLSGPDNIIMSPRGSLVICEDRLTPPANAQRIAGLTREGELFRFCQINPRLDVRFGGHDLAATALLSEWAGVCFSADGKWMFVNIFNPGITLAITGPWREGLI